MVEELCVCVPTQHCSIESCRVCSGGGRGGSGIDFMYLYVYSIWRSEYCTMLIMFPISKHICVWSLPLWYPAVLYTFVCQKQFNAIFIFKTSTKYCLPPHKLDPFISNIQPKMIQWTSQIFIIRKSNAYWNNKKTKNIPKIDHINKKKRRYNWCEICEMNFNVLISD